MTLILKQLFGFIKLLNSETGTIQIASGVSAGLVLGFSPMVSIQAFLILIAIFFFRIQIGAAFTAAFFFKLIAWVLDPACHALGSTVLEAESLQPLFTQLYNMPLVPLTRFNNSIVMGSGILSFILLAPTFFASQWAIGRYRRQVVARFQQTKFWKVVKATQFYKWYAAYEQYR